MTVRAFLEEWRAWLPRHCYQTRKLQCTSPEEGAAVQSDGSHRGTVPCRCLAQEGTEHTERHGTVKNQKTEIQIALKWKLQAQCKTKAGAIS